MTRGSSFPASALVVAMLLLAPDRAVGQGLSPPELVEPSPAEPVEGALEPGEEAEVILLLTIDTEGNVSDASVATSSEREALDEAALRAARGLRFSPARREGEAIPSRIRFRYAFAGPVPVEEEPELEEPPAPGPGALEGRALSEGGEALGGAEVELLSEEGELRRARADADGRFRFAELPPGRYLITVVARGREPVEATEEVRAGEALELTYRLPREPGPSLRDPEPELGVTAEIEPPRREATRRTLEREVLTRMPGTRGDALRVVELLPGVGRPPFTAGTLLVRGAAPQDSEVFLDGTSVPLLYHFGGLTSFYNSRLLERIDFYPGNFSVRYGRRIGGVLEVEPRDPSFERASAMIDVNLIDASFVLEAPIGDRAAIALSARRSYVDFFFSEVIPDGTFDVLAAPVYYDYQLTFAWRPTNEDRLRLLVYGSSDEFRTVFDNEDLARPFNLDLATQFHRVQASWKRSWSPELTQDIMISAGWTGLTIGVGDQFGFDAEFVPITWRAEWEAVLDERVRLRWGLDWLYTPTQLSFRGPTPRQSEGQPPPAGSGERSAADFEGAAYRPGVYVESSLQPLDWLQMVLGVRVDYFRDIQAWSLDPRFTFRAQASDEWTVKGGVGLFTQPPEFQESAPGLGNPNLSPITSVHSSLGVEYRPLPNLRLDLEGYYKHLWDRVVGTSDGLPPFFDNEGIGRIYGLEVSGRLMATRDIPFYGFLSYTLSRSERSDRGEAYRLFDFDQTHIFTAALVWRIGDGWEAGATFRLVSGNPFTPVIASVYDASRDVYQPLYGRVNSDRNPVFHRLDLRVEKTFQIDIVRLALYLDVQNVYNAVNREAVTYSYDFSRSADVPGLPILPSLGVRGEL